MSEVEITLKFDVDDLRRYTDERLATLWHLAQANPAPYGDHQAGEIVDQISREIVRRWLGAVRPELWKHKPQSYYWQQLTRFARYEPGGSGFTPEFYQGEWHLRDELRATGESDASGDGAVAS